MTSLKESQENGHHPMAVGSVSADAPRKGLMGLEAGQSESDRTPGQEQPDAGVEERLAHIRCPDKRYLLSTSSEELPDACETTV